MNNKEIKDIIEDSTGKKVDSFNKIDKASQKESRKVFRISTSKDEMVLKKFNNENLFERSAFAYDNVKEKKIPEAIDINWENLSILIPFYEDNQMDWSDEDMCRNLINSTIRSHKKIHNTGVIPPLELEYDEMVNLRKSRTLEICKGEFEEYIEYIEKIAKELKNTTNGIRREYNYNDSHIGNFIISEDGKIKKILDWEHSGLTPIIEEISKIRYGFVDLPSQFVETNLEEIYEQEKVYVPKERTINLWVTLLAISSYISTVKNGSLCQEYVKLAGSRENLVEEQENIVENLLKRLDLD